MQSSRSRICLTLLLYAWILSGAISPGWKARLQTHEHHHGSLHFGVFVVTEWITIILDPWRGRPVFSSLIVISLAFLTEAFQKLIYAIPFEWEDAFIDTAGVIAAAVAFFVLFWPKRYIVR